MSEVLTNVYSKTQLRMFDEEIHEENFLITLLVIT